MLLIRSLRTDSGVGAAAPAPAPDGISAIAVLPCDDLGGDPSEAYFSDGLTEELIATLSQVQALRVVARTSVFALEGEQLDVRDVGRRLNAGTVVECSVRRAGDRFRVTAQLVDAGDGYHLWAETYEREGTDLFAIQNDLAMRIASALEAELSPAERARLTHPPTTHPDAHVLYLRGRYFWNQRTPDALDRSIDYFQQAIAVDSQYAAAYAGLARAYALQGVVEAIPPQQANDRMRAAALRAVALDGDLAAAHAEMGSYLNVYAWDTDAAEQEYRRAIDLDPSDSNTRHMYGNLLRSAGRYEEAVEQKRRAAMLDPLSPQIFISLGLTLLAAGRQDEAYDTFRQAVELDSMYWSGHAGLGAYYSATGRHDEAVRAHRRALRVSGGNNNARAGLAQALAAAGRKEEAKRVLAEVREEVDRTGVHSPAAAFALLAVDDVDGALAWLETAHDQRHPQLRIIDFPSDPRLVNDARYADLARRIGRPNLAQPPRN
jgi:TolB-like protein/Flp pilus assembly protein TadD